MAWIPAVAALAYGVYSGERANQQAQKEMDKDPPAPQNYYTYDDMGNLKESYVYSPAKGGYVSKRHTTEGERVDNSSRERYRARLMANLSGESEYRYQDAGTREQIYKKQNRLNEIADIKAGMRQPTKDNLDWKGETAIYWDAAKEYMGTKEALADAGPALLTGHPEIITAGKTVGKIFGQGTKDKNKIKRDQQRAYDAAMAEYNSALSSLSAEEEQLNTELEGLNATWQTDTSDVSGRLKMYDDYKKAFSDTMHKDVDERFGKAGRNMDEEMESKGMMGSRAYVDTLKELDANKKDADIDISRMSEMEKERLAANDRADWMGTLSYLDGSNRADSALALQSAGLANSSALGSSAADLAAFNARQQSALARYSMDTNRANNYIDTASGLAYLYGYNKNGGTSKSSLTA